MGSEMCIRDRHRVDTADASALKPGDRLLYIKHEMEQPIEVMDDDDED